VSTRTLPQWLEHIERLHPREIEMGLERVRAVAEAMVLKRPARRVITVAGTNGKGSTVAFIEAIARAAGHRVGAYTSPHLLVYNERVRIDGADAGDAALVAAFEAVEAARGSVPLTYFEFGTLAAIWLFQREGLDLAVLEVGLGGRLDAVNLVDADVAVITSVDLDHQDWLGHDREAIGLEKAGVMRSGRPVVLGEVDPPASVLRQAYALGAFAIRAGSDYLLDLHEDHWTWREPGYRLDLPWPGLAAPVQLWNAAAAVAALRASRLRLSRKALAAGVAAARVPGRLQAWRRPDGGELLLDVAHNPQAAREVSRWLAEHPAPGRCRVLLGMLADKDVEGVVSALAEQADEWWLADLGPESPRGLGPDALAPRVKAAAGGAGVHPGASVADALKQLLAASGPDDRLVVLGSFHTVAAALRALQDEPGARPV
jgi:dihydrofolate synthase / folylpolyglutamate synthase